jgi:hypothetical protein
MYCVSTPTAKMPTCQYAYRLCKIGRNQYPHSLKLELIPRTFSFACQLHSYLHLMNQATTPRPWPFAWRAFGSHQNMNFEITRLVAEHDKIIISSPEATPLHSPYWPVVCSAVVLKQSRRFVRPFESHSFHRFTTNQLSSKHFR